jgi:hypothetical protein
MTTGTLTPTRIDVPPITARPGELLDVATVHEGLGWLDPSGIAESYNCLFTDSVAAWPCPATMLGAPVQTASSTATTGGTIPAGTYRFVVTAVNGRGETLKSNEISQVTTGTTSRVTVNWNTLSGATGYRIYGTNGASGTQNAYYEASGAAVSLVLSAWPGAGVQSGTPPTTSTATVSVTKTFKVPGWMDGVRFAVYGGAKCKPVGSELGHSLSEVERAFLANESVGVERALMTQRLVGGGTFPATTDLTPGATSLTPAEGLALLENYAAGMYAGVPTIHVSRGVGSLLFTQQAIERNGAQFFTKQGSKVASGGGYGNTNLGPGGTPAAAGTSWMYATGEVVIARGDMISAASLDQATNEPVVLAERAYVAAVDCFVAAVKTATYWAIKP